VTSPVPAPIAIPLIVFVAVVVMNLRASSR
jgi:hypothetical protein